jgi:hypothetical protein
MKVPILGYIDPNGNIHGLEKLSKKANAWFFIGNREYMKKPTGELYRVTRKNGEMTRLTRIRHISRRER